MKSILKIWQLGVLAAGLWGCPLHAGQSYSVVWDKVAPPRPSTGGVYSAMVSLSPPATPMTSEPLSGGNYYLVTAGFSGLIQAVQTAQPATLTWPAPAAITYGTALSSAQLNATANVPGTFAYTPSLGSVLNAGSGQILSVTFSPDDVFVYGPATATVSLDVLRAALTIAAQGQTNVYGAALPSFTVSYAGFVNGDSASSLDGPVSLNSAATAGSPVGNYAIVASGAVDANYAITHVNATLSVTPATLAIAAGSTSKTYGAANPLLTASYVGLVNGDTAASLDAPLSLATTATSASGAGAYPITAAGAADANYLISFTPGTLTVNPASLTIRADDKTKAAGKANPLLTATYTGFVNGDTAAALDVPVLLATSATVSSPEGAYPITASGAADANYNIAHAGGTLTITPSTALPAPWQHQDIGAVGLVGDATYLSGTFTVNGSGADIGSTADGFHFAYLLCSGNGEIIARVDSVGNTDPQAKAGVMFRESLTAGSRHVMTVITPGNGSAFERRVATNGVSTRTAGSVVAAPYWVRLVRTGNLFQGYVSPNGVAWTLVGSVTNALPAAVYVGLPVTAHNNAASSVATFSNVKITVPVVPPTIALTAPANGATFLAPATINISASVTSNGNAISTVEFLRNGTVIGSDSSAPYAFSWPGVAAGSYTLSARAVYGTNSVTSAAVSVKVNAAPSAPINLTAAAASTNRINLAWRAGSTNQTGYKIERSINGTAFTQIATVGATVTNYPSTGLNAGTAYYYRLVATNAVGSSPYSAVASATTVAAPPTIALTAPANGATFLAPATINISASVTSNGNAISTVEFLRNGTVIGSDSSAPYAFSWPGVAAGSYTLSARAVYGTNSVTSAAVSVKVNAAPSAPINLTAAAASTNRINLAWRAGSTNQTGYKIERSINGTAFTQIATVGATVTNYPSTGLNAGTAYYYRLVATNAVGSSPYSAVASATTVAAPLVKINFQPLGAAVPSGYLADTGPVYGSRSNGYSYGWSTDNTANTRDRNSTRSADQRYDTFNNMQLGSTRTWEIAVTNGTYTVFVVAGDATAFDSVFRINVEGVLTVSGTPTTGTRWISGTNTVTVSDGRLTVSNGTSGSNNKICFIDITPVSTPAQLVAASAAAVVATPVALEWVNGVAAPKVTLRVSGALSASYVVEGSTDLKTWKVIAIVPNVNGTLSFEDPASTQSVQRFYRVRANQSLSEKSKGANVHVSRRSMRRGMER